MAATKPCVQGTLALMVLKTLEAMGEMHGTDRAAHRADERRLLSVNYGTLYPALLSSSRKFIASEWGVSDNNRKAKFYKLTRAGKRSWREKAPVGAATRFWPVLDAGRSRAMSGARAWSRARGCSGRSADGSLRRRWRPFGNAHRDNIRTG